MKSRFSHRFPILPYHVHSRYHTSRPFTSFLKKSLQSRASSINAGSNGNSQGGGSSFLLPGATVATLLMLGVLHARRMYDDKKTEEMRGKGIELEFQPDVKATFLGLLPLRSISRCWGYLAGMEIPVWLRPHVYRAWARAFHSNLEEAALPLDKYASLRDFFVRSLKEGSRPVDADPQCLVSPVDGVVLRFGELKGAGAMIEQVKGFSYSVFSLLGASSFLPKTAASNAQEEHRESIITTKKRKKSWWWTVSLASPKVWDPTSRPERGLFYCVIYLTPGDYHRIHSPADWNILVILEGLWQEGFMALAAIGATNIGSIELSIEPELHTNKPTKKLIHSEPDERVYDCEGVGRILKKGDELGAFNMGSTVVLVFQAPTSKLLHEGNSSQEFDFSVKCGDRVRVGEALGRWHDS